MNIRNIDLNLLHIFVVVYECRSITKAAEELHLSQPAVSNAITRLNNTLNLTLFVKNSRNITPTVQAENLYLDIKSCLQKIKSSLTQQITFDPADSDRTFRIATTNYGEYVLFPKVIHHLQQTAPNINVVHEAFPKSGFNDFLRNAKFDLVVFPDCQVEKGICKEPIVVDSLVLISGPNHSSLPERLDVGAAAKLNFISFGSEFDDFNPVINEIKKHPNFRPSRLTLSTLQCAFQMVSATDMVAVAPLSVVRFFQKQLALNFHRLDSLSDQMTFNLYWRDADSADPGHAWFREFIKNLVHAADSYACRSTAQTGNSLVAPDILEADS